LNKNVEEAIEKIFSKHGQTKESRHMFSKYVQNSIDNNKRVGDLDALIDRLCLREVRDDN